MTASLPATFKKAVATKVTLDHRDAIRVVEVPLDPVPAPGHALIKLHYSGVNAGDPLYCGGWYVPTVQPPFDIGMEGLGEVVAVGEGVTNVAPGTAVAFCAFAVGYAEYRSLPAATLVPLPSLEPRWLPLILSGATSWLALQHAGLKETANGGKGGIAVVTAAAGAAGVFAVQLLKKTYGFTVVAVCSGAKKAAFLTDTLGADRVIDYKNEDVHAVLAAAYPNGVDFIYDGVGGAQLEGFLLKNLAPLAKVVVIGSLSGYLHGFGTKGSTEKAEKSGPAHTQLSLNDLFSPLIGKSATLQYFYLAHFLEQIPAALTGLFTQVMTGVLISPVDDTETFVGLDRVSDAIDHLHSGKNIGKVVVRVFA